MSHYFRIQDEQFKRIRCVSLMDGSLKIFIDGDDVATITPLGLSLNGFLNTLLLEFLQAKDLQTIKETRKQEQEQEEQDPLQERASKNTGKKASTQQELFPPQKKKASTLFLDKARASLDNLRRDEQASQQELREEKTPCTNTKSP